MHNNYIYVINNTTISQIILNALFNDPEQIHNYNCPNSSDTPCADFMDTEFPIDSDLVDGLYKLALDLIGYSYKFNIDTENNAKDLTGDTQ